MIGGVDAVELRQLLRRLIDSVFTAQGFAQVAGGSVDDAAALFGTLEREGLIAPGADLHVGPLFHGPNEDLDAAVLWQTTVQGNALAKARVGKPMRREEAERRLAGVIAQAEEVNHDPDELFNVETIELFGSLTDPDARHVGDIDLRVLVSRRLDGNSHVCELNRRWPGNLLDAMATALRELRRQLTGGSPKIDLQLDEATRRPLPDGTDPVIVYARNQDSGDR